MLVMLWNLMVWRCRMRKLMYRVVFPFELKLCNTVEDCPDADALYDLIGVVVHVGSGPNHGEPNCFLDFGDAPASWHYSAGSDLPDHPTRNVHDVTLAAGLNITHRLHLP